MGAENPFSRIPAAEAIPAQSLQSENPSYGKMDKELRLADMGFDKYVVLLEQAVAIDDPDERVALLDRLGTHDNEHVYADANFDDAVRAFMQSDVFGGRYTIRGNVRSDEEDGKSYRSQLFFTKTLAINVQEIDPEDQLGRVDFRASGGSMAPMGEDKMTHEEFRRRESLERAQFLIDVMRYCLETGASIRYRAYGPQDEREDWVWMHSNSPAKEIGE
jgi:hypothetical protein